MLMAHCGMFFTNGDFLDPSHVYILHNISMFLANPCHETEQLEEIFFTINDTCELHSVQEFLIPRNPSL